MPKLSPLERAAKLKDAGNSAFKNKKLQAALGAYAYGLEELDKLRPENCQRLKSAESKQEGNFQTALAEAKILRCTLLSNQSLCLCKIGQPLEALRAAEAAIELNGKNFPKAWLRKASALLALGRLDEAESAAELAAKADNAISGAAKKIIHKANVAKNGTRDEFPKREVPCIQADVTEFATELIGFLVTSGGVDPSACHFKNGKLNVRLLSTAADHTLDVGQLYKDFTAQSSAIKQAQFYVSIVRKTVGSLSLPRSFRIAKHLLMPRLFSRRKLDSQGAKMPTAEALPCSNLECPAVEVTSQSLDDPDDVAIALVLDCGESMVPVLSSALAAWEIKFSSALEIAVRNLRALTHQHSEAKEWKTHMSGCLTSPWNDGWDAARLALCPDLLSSVFKANEGSTVAIFGTNNCALSCGSQNPVGLCFAGDIAIHDMKPTVDFITSTPYRLVKSAKTWAWRRYRPNLASREFSVPSDQGEINSVLEAVQSGGKLRIPVYGITEKRNDGVQADKKAIHQWRAFFQRDGIEVERAGKDTQRVASKSQLGGSKSTKLKGGFLNRTSSDRNRKDSSAIFANKTATHTAVPTPKEPTIDLSTLNKAIGMYGSLGSSTPTSQTVKPLFSL